MSCIVDMRGERPIAPIANDEIEKVVLRSLLHPAMYIPKKHDVESNPAKNQREER